MEEGTRGCPISKNAVGFEIFLLVVFFNFLIFLSTGGDMKSVISLPGLRSNLFPRLSLVIAAGFRRALGLIEVLATGFLVVVTVVVDVVVVEVVVVVVVDVVVVVGVVVVD